jgi:formylglycine-generating enzyme required for sulfatase activity/energy-coupling factor transporter ATP-binding protein EcfA2
MLDNPALEETLQRLVTLLNASQSGAWTFALYDNERGRQRIHQELVLRVSVQLLDVALDAGHANPRAALDALPAAVQRQRLVVSYTGLEAAMPALFGYLEMQREAFSDYPHSLIFWVTEEGWRQVMAQAPNFYSRRRGLFDFRGAGTGAPAAAAASQMQTLRGRVADLKDKLLKLEALRSILGDEITEQKSKELNSELQLLIQTAGGALVAGDVNTSGGDFVGRDQWRVYVSNFYAHTPADQIPVEVLLAAYLRSLAAECSRLPLGIIDTEFVRTSGESPVPLPDVYVDLDVIAVTAERTRGERDLALHLARGEGGDRTPLLETIAVATERRMVLIGDAGSGKTTFVNYLAYLLATNSASLPEALAGALPVRLLLREVAARQIPVSARQGAASMIWDAMRDDLRQRLGETAGDRAFGAWQQRLLKEPGVILLDGLDEVPEAQRRRQVLLQAIQDFLAPLPKVTRVLVTARPYAYADPQWHLPRFSTLALAPFNEAQVQGFIDRWYQAVAPSLGWDAATAQRRGERLAAALQERSFLADLASRPLLLTLMATLHSSWGQLPEDRADLYEETVKLLLARWQRGREVLGPDGEPLIEPGIAQVLGVGDTSIREALERLAFTVHQRQRSTGRRTDDSEPADISEGEILVAFKPLLGTLAPETVLRYLQERAGLLIERRSGIYAFVHRSLQEYLAACFLVGQPDAADQLVGLLSADPAWWREVFVLGAGKKQRGGYGDAVNLVNALLPDDPEPTANDAAWRLAVIAGQAARELRLPEKAAGQRVYEAVLRRVRRWLAALVEGGRLPAADRAEAGDLLGQLGDARFDPRRLHLPAHFHRQGEPFLGFVEIPAGPFVMGSQKRDKDAFEDEAGNPKSLTIPYRYWMARYPVTVAQFQAFVEGDGYANDRWWTKTGWAWRLGTWDSQVEDKAERDWLQQRTADQRGTPWRWDAQVRTPNRPVMGISWFEAMAYAAWLDAQWRSGAAAGQWPALPAGYAVRLPSEAEWEKAARAGDARVYPWGNEAPDEERANIEGKIGRASAVGMYPAGATPAGLLDMSGNVWEWTRTRYRPYPYQPDDGRNDPEAEGLPVVRGGSWDVSPGVARCSVRHGLVPDDFYDIVGVRVVVSLAASGF